jgi:hypothetical protein
MTDGAGNGSFTATTANVSPGQIVTATATNTSADPSTPPGSVNLFNTSQFSRCLLVPAPAPPVPSPPGAGPVVPPAAGPAIPPGPSNAFAVLSKSVKNGVITLKVQTRATGALRASASFIQTVKRTTGRGRRRRTRTVRITTAYGQASASTAGLAPAVLTLAPNRNAANLLKKLRTLRLSVSVSFTPTGGKTNTIGFPLTVSAPKPKLKRHR